MNWVQQNLTSNTLLVICVSYICWPIVYQERFRLNKWTPFILKRRFGHFFRVPLQVINIVSYNEYFTQNHWKSARQFTLQFALEKIGNLMDDAQLRIFILYIIINKKNRAPKVCSKKNFQIVIWTSMRIAYTGFPN